MNKMLIVVTSSDPQVQLMSMVLVMQSITIDQDVGTNCHVLLCGDAGDMALQNAPKSVTTPLPPKSMSPQGLLQSIIEKTAITVEVCALYLPNKGIEQSALIAGVTVAEPSKIAQLMVDTNTQVISF